jgi:hypothetical protein
MSYSDGGVLGLTRIHDAGSASARFNLAVMSEGYRYDELPQFAADAQAFVDRLFKTPPFDAHACAINVFRIDVWSTASGADDPDLQPDCIGTNVFPPTFFDSTFCAYGIERLVWVNQPLIEWVRDWYFPQAHQVVLLVNSAKEGGSGDTHAIVTKGRGWDWPKVLIHELGHTAFSLGDEYDFLKKCDDANGTYAGPEPDWPNVAKDVTPAGLKWMSMVGDGTPLPTQINPTCAKCNNAPSGYPPHTVGAFEGAGLYHCGLYRAEESCIMRYGDQFCAVCVRAIEAELSPYRPRCLAPVFKPFTPTWIPLPGLFVWAKQVGLALMALALTVFAVYPPLECLRRRTLFRLQKAAIGNADPCIDLLPPTGDG